MYSDLYSEPLQPKRGKHKIFIGMAPGVGKTYRMLQEARSLKTEGIDVVIGVLETHGRKETAAQAEGLESIPRQTIVWGGSALTEMDTDAILKRQPQLVLVDELAHTNVPGSLREKRHQDVEIVLAAGIDLYSTVNIQHLESLNDLVYQLTGVTVRERIPDRLLEEADQVVVVDVTPETLEERLLEGKVYALEKVDQALRHFFQRRNLMALRELALREVADRIEEDVNQHINPLRVQERVLVCLSTNPISLRLLRRGSRIANSLDARLYCLFVDHPERFLTKAESLHIEQCEHLCRDFSGQWIRVKNTDVVAAISQVSQQEQITQVVIGNSPSKKRWFQGSLVQRLIKKLDRMDITIMASVNTRPPQS
ncbi:MAG: KdpD-like non-kinase potassium sensor [Synechococcales cyanobacterium]